MLGKSKRLAEAEAGAFSNLLGGVKRLENGGQLVRRDACAGVPDRDGNEFSVAPVAGARRRDRIGLLDPDGNQTLILHRIPAVDGEIDQGCLELRDVRHRETFRVANFKSDLNSSADQRADQLRDSFDLQADIEHLRSQRLPPRERQQLSGQFGCAINGVGNRIDVAAAAILGQFAAAKEIGGRADDRQQVVEIVRHAAGELADRFHFLGLTKRFFRLSGVR